ncbi:hypothetical protein D9O40_10575 [Clostridium autoethanogenum]|uniref:Alp7A-like C-terminal domain-containing protein n=1 Tax=Clostridium autoethanogenum TaxID=84023 RepID=A0A3M0SP42_9CLOT|nr:hypothetical protein [Clostridium autoethanogenum]RMD00267.1 hypothetical protein D9O40_10575 [Clostridium autoethanogenum]
MNIKRFNGDFGNSTNNFMIDGYYFEIPTNVVEISEKEASETFVSPITESKDLLDRIVISTNYEGQERFYLVGEFAEKSKLSNTHVNTMHDKIKSVIPYASFLAAVAYYNNLKAPKDDNIVNINYMSMMLPIWLLKRAEKFSIAESEMEKRFLGEHQVKIITLGMEKDITINVEKSKCRIESEVARYAIKYKMTSTDDNIIKIDMRQELLNRFNDYEVVLSDIGGGSTDAVLLGKGLTAPKGRDSFKVIDIEPFLGRLETLRKEKLLEYFHDLGALEKFIVANYKEQKYVLKDENTGESFDFTDTIKEMLQEYSDLLIFQIFNTFKTKDKVVKFIYFGGETPVLEPYMKSSLLKNMTEQASENNHFFLDEILEDDKKEIFKPTSRTVNLTALEILSINEMKKIKESTKGE